jgi:NAD(P)-dependent dehydrogenase (short-subunit alcohol dehydrogenase family)
MENEKIVCITGGSRGIGKALVKAYLRETSYKVFVTTRNPNALTEEKKTHSGRLEVVTCDIGSAEGRRSLVERIGEGWQLSRLIHNAGTLIFKSFEKIEAQELQQVYAVNVFAPFLLTQALLPKMKACHVVSISSIGGVQGSLKFPGLSAYSSSKAALNCLTEMWAEEFKDSGHSFNCLALGSVETEMFQQAFPGASASTDPEVMAKYILDFAENASLVMNGKIISVSRSNP